MVSGAALRSALVRVCRRLDAKGLVAGAEGNVSVRLGPASMLITPAGARKGELRARDFVVASIRDGRAKGKANISSEFAMHLAIYAARSDVMAIVHAHPPAATGFAVAGKALEASAIAELAGVVGPVPLVRYETPGTAALGRVVGEAMKGANAALLANHGAVTAGPTLDQALNLMESLEQGARILVSAHILGGVTQLTPQQVSELERGRLAHRGT